ncbi:hypothetical protein GRS96_12190 [Rathayibacter sp. VKM Ac-2803]|uniref:hypothetical protein n=1 Tax=Rathayibacter sp. VKM Ac-2803 TaxID=2609256 RepID=UPI001356A162|nr:hypothetical protein [Rathayibacter sp. VKM Ac-2803]MWV50029.1 hypothetical protein [Rathayibacter sp. VKM Ac-2803]
MTSEAIAQRAAKRASGLRRFSLGEDIRRTPARLRAPFDETQWIALGNAERRAHIVALITAELAAEEAATPSAPPTPAEATAPVREYEPGRSYLPCADGCGAFHPGRPGRSGLRYCPSE